MIVIVHCPYGNPDKVVAFEKDEAAVPYIKKHLKNWDSSDTWIEQVEEIETLEDAQVLIEEEAVYELVIHIVDEINPEVDEEVQQ